MAKGRTDGKAVTPIPKQCPSCGHDIDWSKLDERGDQKSPDVDGHASWVNLRNCPHCRTTLGVEYKGPKTS